MKNEQIERDISILKNATFLYENNDHGKEVEAARKAAIEALREQMERDNRETLIPCDEMRTGIFNLIIAERARQDALWGTPQENTFSEWAGILAEECGEASAELNELNFGCGNKGKAVKEIIEAAAVAVAIIEQYDTAEMVTAAWYAYRTTQKRKEEES